MSVLMLALALVVGQASDTATTQQLERMEQTLAASWKDGDCDAWSAIIDPGWSVIHVDGSVLTKAQALEMCKSRLVRFASLTIDEVSVRLFGDAAVVTGRTVADATAPTPALVKLRFTDVFVRRGGKWLVVASQGTLLKP
jgi:ketosteroid isomerase-like protein